MELYNKIKYIRLNDSVCKRILYVLIILQSVWFFIAFSYIKKDLFIDEYGTYGISNSLNQIYLSYDEYSGSDDIAYINTNKWVSSDVIYSYLSVDKGEQFRYDSIVHCCVKDVHPPLYYFIIHTLCSFVPGIYTSYIAFLVNIIIFVVSMIFYYRLSKFIFDNDGIISLIICFLYGFSLLCAATFTYLRMYAMITGLAIISVYYFTVILRKISKDESVKKEMFISFLLTFVGGLTHYYYLVFMGALTAFLCVYFLFYKQTKMAFLYGVVQAFAAFAMFSVFPYAFKHLTRIDTKEYSFDFEIKNLSYYFFYYLTGVNYFPYENMTLVYVMLVTAFIIVFLCFFSFIFRNEVWFIKCKECIFVKIVLIFNYIKKKNYAIIFPIASTCIIEFLVCGLANIYKMGVVSVRYIFIIVPFVYLTLSFIIYSFINAILNLFKKNTKKWVYAVMGGVAVIYIIVINTFPNPFYFNYGDSSNYYAQYVDGESDYIVSLKKCSQLTSIMCRFNKCNSFYAFDEEDMSERLEDALKDYIDLNKEKGLNNKLYFICYAPNFQIYNEIKENDLNSMNADDLVRYKNDLDNPYSEVGVYYKSKLENQIIKVNDVLGEKYFDKITYKCPINSNYGKLFVYQIELNKNPENL